MKKQILFVSMLILVTACGQKQGNKETHTAQITEFEKPKGVTFKVNDVELATTLLKTDKAKLVFEIKLEKRFSSFPKSMPK